jgi:indolepyruvate ferredoxin oxidoreductase
MRVFGALARLRWLRRTWINPFGYTAERRMERRLLADYEKTIATILERLDAGNHRFAVALAAYPEKIRGFGHVRAESILRVLPDAAQRREAFLAGGVAAEAAE